MTRPHHVREGQQRRHQRVVFADGQDVERPVCLRNAHRFRLSSTNVRRAEESAVEARRVESLVAEDAGAVGVGERHDDQLSDLYGAHVGSDCLDHTDRLVAHGSAALRRLHKVVRPEIAAADTGVSHPYDRIGRLDESGVRDILDPNISGRYMTVARISIYLFGNYRWFGL